MRKLLWLSLSSLTLACNSQLVGGACLDGFTQRGHDCIENPQNGPAQDGGSGGGGGATSVTGDGGSGAATGQGGASTTTVSSGGVGGNGGCGALATCDDGCFDLSSDPFHCGDCGTTCASGLCIESECEGGVAGHVIVLGIDYRSVGTPSASSRLLGNAVFLGTHVPLRVLDYHAMSNVVHASHVDDLLTAEGTARGRSIVITTAPSTASVSTALSASGTDVFLLHVPTFAKSNEIDAMAAAWAPSLDTFGKTGGVVVVLVEKNMPALVGTLLGETNLMPGVSTSGLTPGPFSIDDFLDSITAGVPSPFGAPDGGIALTFTGSPTPTLSIPVVDTSAAPVAIHRVIPPTTN